MGTLMMTGFCPHEQVPSVTSSSAVQQIIYLDLDNYNFFQRANSEPLAHVQTSLLTSPQAFVHIFFGSNTRWIEPKQSPLWAALKTSGRWKLHACSDCKDAADIALTFQCGIDHAT